jgi:hypothetical protein
MMFHGHNILVSTRRDAFEAEARAARLAKQARLPRQARPHGPASGTTRVRTEPHSVPSWWQSVRIRRQVALLERAVAEADDQHPVHDYADCR